MSIPNGGNSAMALSSGEVMRFITPVYAMALFARHIRTTFGMLFRKPLAWQLFGLRIFGILCCELTSPSR